MDGDVKVLDDNVRVFERMVDKDLCIIFMGDGMWKIQIGSSGGRNDDYILLDDTNYRYDVNDKERKW